MAFLRWVGLLAASGRRVAWHVLGRHYLSLVSAAVLAGLAVVVLTNDSFESGSKGSPPESAAADLPEKPRPHRPVVLFYLVNDAVQRDAIAGALDADRLAFDVDAARPDYVVYLIAGTKEEEVRTIERLNFEELLARTGGVEMRVIDARGRMP